jgi:hypothetical protein
MANCVFWYPRTYHGVIERRSNIPDKITKTLSDIPGLEYKIILTNEKTNEENEHGICRENIKVEILGGGVYTVAKFILIQKQASRNGLVLYEYDEHLLDNLLLQEIDRQAFWSAIYHYSKEFYHKHEFHDEETDSILLPYMNGCNNIQEDNNEALLHYLNCYEKKFHNYQNYSKDILNRVEELFAKARFKTLRECTPIWDDFFYRIKGSYIYYKTLAGSKYFLPANQEEFHRVILNAEHHFNKIKLIELKVDNKVHQIEDSLNYRLTMRFGWVSVVSLFLGALSIYLAIR